MEGKQLTKLCACADRFEAEAIRNRLAAAGIRAIVTGTDAASAFSMGGAPQQRPVRVEVAAEDLDRAGELLEEDRRRAATLGPWRCRTCGERNEATFDVCWQCRSSRVE